MKILMLAPGYAPPAPDIHDIFQNHRRFPLFTNKRTNKSIG